MQWLAPLLLLLVRQLLAVELADIFRTPQFMLISQIQCESIYEANIQDQWCPRGLTSQITNAHCGMDIRAHLVRDPISQNPPRIMFIGPGSNGRPVALIEQITWPSQSNNSQIYEHRKVDMTANMAAISLGAKGWFYQYNDVTATMYDSDTQLLYVLTRTFQGSYRPHACVYFVGNIFEGSPRIDQFVSFPLHTNDGARWEWGIDHYERMAYYTSRHGDNTILHTLPTSRLIAALKEGISGTVAHAFNNEPRSHFRVSGGAIFTYASKPNLQMAYIRSLERKESGIQCGLQTASGHMKLPNLISTLVVRDDDYCLLREGRAANLQACKDERTAWLSERNLLEGPVPTGNLAIALLVICVILSLIVIFLCVCMCWMKRNLDSSYIEEPPRQVPYYPSAPGQYPDMDVSVDKWITNY